MAKILMLGSNGQIGTVLAKALMDKYGSDNVITSDVREPKVKQQNFVHIDVLDKDRIAQVVDEYKINQIYHLAAILSASGEKKPAITWEINMQGLLNVLDIGVEKKLERIFFPSSIAIYGPSTPKQNTPQYSSFMPTTVYGISKIAVEKWGKILYKKIPSRAN